MKLRGALIMATLVLGAGSGQAQPADKIDEKALKNELALLQGHLVTIGREALGKKATSEDLKKLKGVMVIEGENRAGWTEEYGEKGEVHEAAIKLDPSAKPKAVDRTIRKGPGKGETTQGIYKLEGDQLTICLAWGKKERPKEFAAKKDGHAMVVVYKRVKK